MDKYTLIKRYHYDRRLKIYMHAIMYVDPETMAEEDYFPAKKYFLQTIRNFQLHDQSQNTGLDLVTHIQRVMSYI